MPAWRTRIVSRMSFIWTLQYLLWVEKEKLNIKMNMDISINDLIDTNLNIHANRGKIAPQLFW